MEFDIVIDVYDDFFLVYFDTKKFQQMKIFELDLLIENHNFKMVFCEIENSINKRYNFKPYYNVYKEPFTDVDYKILITKLEKHLRDNNANYNIVCKSL